MGKAEQVNEADLGWLVDSPTGDSNFKYTLEHATAATIRAALEQVKGKARQQTKELALARQLRKLTVLATDTEPSDQAVVDVANRQERTTSMELATLQEEHQAKDVRSAEQAEREQRIAHCHEIIGRVQGLQFIEKVTTVGTLMQLRDIKTSKAYRELPNIGNWENFCKYIGLSRQKVDEDLTNLATFGEEFLTTVGRFSLGYREMRKLRYLTQDGAFTVEGDCVVIGEERIPINEDHAEDLQVAIEKVLEAKDKLAERVEKLEKNLDEVVKEETKGLKAEVKALVKEVKRLKPFDPEEKDLSFAADQLQEIKDATLCAVAMMGRFICDDRVKDEPAIMGQVEGHLQAIELALSNLRRNWEQSITIFEA